MAYLLIAILAQSFTIAFLLKNDFKTNKKDIFLFGVVLITIFVFVMKFAFLVLNQNVLYNKYSPAIIIAIPPLLFLYVKNKIIGLHKVNATVNLHFLPTLLLTIAFVVVGINILINNDYSWIAPYKMVYDVSFFLSCFIYYPLIIYNIHTTDTSAPINLKWLMLPILLWIVGLVVLLIGKVSQEGFVINISLVLCSLGFAIFLMRLLKHKHSLKVTHASASTPQIAIASKPKYEKSTLKDNDLDGILVRIEDYMTQKKPYLKADFSLNDLSHALEVSKHHITEALNTRLQKNFFLYINEYRIKAAKAKMLSQPDEKLNLIAHFSGFNSKTTFIKYFKQFEGDTPSEYRKKHLETGLQ